MYIFNQERRPYLILTHKEVLFREKPADDQMQRFAFEEIENVTLDHYYDIEHKLIVRLQIKTARQENPFSLQLSSLDEPLDEIVDTLHTSFSDKAELSLPSSQWLHKIHNPPKKKSWLGLSAIFLITAALAFHAFMPPELRSLEKNSLSVQIQDRQELCSANARTAFHLPNSDQITIKSYCGLFGFWKEISQEEIPEKFLETEFSSVSASEYLVQAQEYIQKKEYESAQNTLEKAIYLEENSGDAYILLGYCHYWKNEIDLALKAIQKALVINPNSAEAHSAIGLLYMEDKQLEKAYSHYAKSSLISPSAQTDMALGDLALGLGKINKSVEHYESALSSDNNNSALLTQLGLLYWEQLAYKKVATVFEKAYRIEPHSIDNFLNYYEISMIEKTGLALEDEELFREDFKPYKKALMIYDALKIIKRSIKQQEIITELKQWADDYSHLELKWSFTQILTWLDNSSLNDDEQYYARKTIGFFIAYQQRYKLEHRIES